MSAVWILARTLSQQSVLPLRAAIGGCARSHQTFANNLVLTSRQVPSPAQLLLAQDSATLLPLFANCEAASFCGLCSSSNPEACIEVHSPFIPLFGPALTEHLYQVSEQEGCYATNFNLEFWGDCSEIGADHTDYLSGECSWTTSTIPDAETCFDVAECPYIRKQVRSLCSHMILRTC